MNYIILFMSFKVNNTTNYIAIADTWLTVPELPNIIAKLYLRTTKIINKISTILPLSK